MKTPYSSLFTLLTLLVTLSLCISFHLRNGMRSRQITESRPDVAFPVLFMTADSGGLLRTALRVNNLEKSISFYTSCLGMKIISDDGDKKCARVGYSGDTSVDLVEDSTVSTLNLGDAFLGFGIDLN